jgi:hypothetical protein
MQGNKTRIEGGGILIGFAPPLERPTPAGLSVNSSIRRRVENSFLVNRKERGRH